MAAETAGYATARTLLPAHFHPARWVEESRSQSPEIVLQSAFPCFSSCYPETGSRSPFHRRSSRYDRRLAYLGPHVGLPRPCALPGACRWTGQGWKLAACQENLSPASQSLIQDIPGQIPPVTTQVALFQGYHPLCGMETGLGRTLPGGWQWVISLEVPDALHLSGCYQQQPYCEDHQPAGGFSLQGYRYRQNQDLHSVG